MLRLLDCRKDDPSDSGRYRDKGGPVRYYGQGGNDGHPATGPEIVLSVGQIRRGLQRYRDSIAYTPAYRPLWQRPDVHQVQDHLPQEGDDVSVADIMDAQYPPEYITYLVEQLHVPGRVRLIDDAQELYPGIFLEPTEAHSWGSMNIHVNTKQGRAILCGDVIYSEHLQCMRNDIFVEIQAHAAHDAFPFGDRSTGNYWNLWAAKAGVQKVKAEADLVLPIHDPLVVERYGYEIG